MPENLSSIIGNILTSKSTLSFEPEVLSPYLQGTEGFESFANKKRHLLGMVSLTQASEIKAILDLANKYAEDEDLAFSLHPISTGKNWGYGTSLPPSTNKNIILLNLSQLNNICYFDKELGLVTIEPGVTQQQLSDFLQLNKFDYMVPVTGAGPDCSILANALERGYGITPYTDHFSAVTSINGWWGNGTPYQSAVSELDASDEKIVDKTFKWGVGPYLDGLFTQSNFGITSQITIRLAKRKPDFTSFFIQLDNDNLLEQAVPLIRKVLQDYEGIIGSVNLMDKRRLLSMLTKNPNTDNMHKVMLDQQVNTLAEELKTPSWTIAGSIYGSKRVVSAVKKDINILFKQLPCKKIYSNNVAFTLANKLLNNLPKNFIEKFQKIATFKTRLDLFNKGKEVMLGKPNKLALNLAYWRNKNREQYNENNLAPNKHGCGLLWYAPLITMKTNKIRECVEFIRETTPKYNIEPFITFTLLKHDCVDCTVPIVFDLTNKQAINDAHQCLDELTKKGLKKGFVPYRLNIDQQQTLLNKHSDFWVAVNQLKNSIDPNQILSKGRYNPQ